MTHYYLRLQETIYRLTPHALRQIERLTNSGGYLNHGDLMFKRGVKEVSSAPAGKIIEAGHGSVSFVYPK